MSARWLIPLFALLLTCTANTPALAKPPEDEIAERAERAAERAAKAAERASDSAERAAERAERDRDSRDRASGRGEDARPERDRSGEGKRKDWGGERMADASPTINVTGGGDDVDEPGNATLEGSEGRVAETNDNSESDSAGSDSDGLSADDRDDGSGDLDNPDGSGGNSSSNGHGDEDENASDGSHSGSSSGEDDEEEEDESSEEDHDQNKQDSNVPVALESDETGSHYREGELVILSDDPRIAGRAEQLGFAILEARPLASIGSVVLRLRRPEGMTSAQALSLLRTREPESPSGFNYLYTATGGDEQGRDEPPASLVLNVSDKSSRAGARKISIIDGFSADRVANRSVERLADQPAKIGHGDRVAAILLQTLQEDYDTEAANLILIDVMRRHGTGGAADVTALIAGFDILITGNVDIVNLSLAGPDHPALRRAIGIAIEHDIVIVAAVGNKGPAAPPVYPAAYSGVIGVTAVDIEGRPYMLAGRGSQVDIAARGDAPQPSDTAKSVLATSYAVPRVTALLAARLQDKSPASQNQLLSAYSLDAGAPGRDDVFGYGILTPPSGE